MRTEIYDISGNLKNYILQVENGGTGATTEDEALAVLDAVSESKVNQPNGVLGLNENGFIDVDRFPSDFGGAAAVNIFGPNEVILGSSILLEITNYDVFTTYQIETYKVSVEREDEKLLVTGMSFGSDAWFSVNGSVYNLKVLVDNASLEGNFVSKVPFTNDQGLTAIAATGDGSLVAVSQPAKPFNGSQGAGEVNIFSHTEATGYAPVLKTDPSTMTTRIIYSGRGTKVFTANNVTQTKTDQGYIDILGAGNIIIEAEGENIVTQAVAQQGLPQYPNGLPPYVAASGPIYGQVCTLVPRNFNYWSETSSTTLGSGFSVLNDVKSSLQSYTAAQAKIDAENTYLGNWVGGSNYVGWAQEGSPSVNSSGDQRIAIAIQGFNTYYDGQGQFAYHLYSITATLKRFFSTITATEVRNVQSCSTGITGYTNPQQGLPQYPSGLPMYVAPQTASNYKDTITITSDNFSLTGTSISQTVFPWENFGLGKSIDILSQVLAMGCPRTASSAFPNGGEVVIRRKTNDVWGTYRVSIPKVTPYPFFGETVKLWNSGHRMMVGAPGSNKVVQYNFAANAYQEGNSYTVVGLASTARFGASIDISTNDSVMAVGAPGALISGAIYLYQQNGVVYDPAGLINISLPAGDTIGHNVRVLNGNRVFCLVRTAAGVNNYVAEFTKNAQGNWEMTKAFYNPSPSVNDFFGEGFDIPDTNDMMFITARGNPTTKGLTHIWVQVEGVWHYYKAVMDPEGVFDDGFSRSIAVNLDGKGGHFLSSDMNKGSLIYFK